MPIRNGYYYPSKSRMNSFQLALFTFCLVLAILLFLVVLADKAHAAGTACGSPTVVDHYTMLTSSVASASTPACVMISATTRSNMSICADAGATVGAMCWPYTGAVPSSALANAIEIPPGKCFTDASPAPGDIGEAWACVFKSGGATLNVYSIFRSQ